MTAPAIVWLRQDLRLSDNPALAAAAQTKRPLVLLYILDDKTPGRWMLGGASRWWLHQSLETLARDLTVRGGRLILRRGNAQEVLRQVLRETGANTVYWNRCYEPFAIARDTAIKQMLARDDVDVSSHNGSVLFEPWSVKTKGGEPFKVFSPFWRACLQKEWRGPLAAPKAMNFHGGPIESDALSSWRLTPTRPNWAGGFEQEWSVGEAAAQRALDAFVEGSLRDYAERRDGLALAATSRLSPHLHFGELSPNQVRAAIERAMVEASGLQRGGEKYLAELGWREFSTHLLFHTPALPEKNWRTQFDAVAWRDDAKGLDAWKRGMTGYPVVDAAMRQLWRTGWMHNRARMIAASFLIKDLLIDWREGEAWFWDTLVDADLANNAASWQWVAGSGADASPYFRIFNPVTQGERYDSDGGYVRRWIPELAKLPDTFIHKPWEADAVTLEACGVLLGQTYPAPIVDHAFARQRALDAFAALSRS